MVKLIADQDHIGYGYSGQGMLSVKAGESFTTSVSRATRLIQKGIAHLDASVIAESHVAASESASVGEADEQPEPVAEPPKVDGRTKAGRAAKGR